MRAMMAPARGRWICSWARERATIAMSAAMPHSMALSALGAASAEDAAAPPSSSAMNSFCMTHSPPLLLLSRLVADAAGARAALRAGRPDRAAHAARGARRVGVAAGGAGSAVHRVVLALREATVVVLVELGEAVVPGGVARFVARDVAVVVTVHRGEATRGCAGRRTIRRLCAGRCPRLRQHRRGE